MNSNDVCVTIEKKKGFILYIGFLIQRPGWRPGWQSSIEAKKLNGLLSGPKPWKGTRQRNPKDQGVAYSQVSCQESTGWGSCSASKEGAAQERLQVSSSLNLAFAGFQDIEMTLSLFPHLYSGKVVSTHIFHTLIGIVRTVHFPPLSESTPGKSCGTEPKGAMLWNNYAVMITSLSAWLN